MFLLSVLFKTVVNFVLDDSIIFETIYKPIELKSMQLYLADHPEILNDLQNLAKGQMDQQDLEVKMEEEELQRYLRQDGMEIGELGKPVELPKNLSPKLQAKIDYMFNKHFFNEYVSNLIPLERKIKDLRPE